MADPILIDELHVSIMAPRGLQPEEYDAISRIVGRAAFRVEVRRAVLAVVRRHPDLRQARVVVTA